MDYGTLKIIWWFLIVVLFVGFFILGGRDFGVCILLPWVARNDNERRLFINSIGPTWGGNQVWFVTAGAAIFAAWPLVYATAFSGLYYALFIVLLSLILRPPGFDFRSKLASPIWRTLWDFALFISGFVPALIFGVALGNLLLGFPFYLDGTMQSHYEGTFWQLLNPFSVVFGLATIFILSFHGGVYLQKKLAEEFLQRLKRINLFTGGVFALLFFLLGAWILFGINGYHIDSPIDVNAALLPGTKTVTIGPNLWLFNFEHFRQLWLFPIFTLAALMLGILFSSMNFSTLAVLMSSLTIVFALGTVGAAVFPFIMPSSSHPNDSLTLWDATSSHLSLQYMFFVVAIFLPIVLCYTFWVYRVLTGKVETKEVLRDPESY
ncbi:MAG: cytochrome d ubiquinol oxidase subunit II [Candidatus Berkiellales bacterium]